MSTISLGIWLVMALGTLNLGVVQNSVQRSYLPTAQAEDVQVAEDATKTATLSSASPVATPDSGVEVIMTAYSSSVDETDSTPFITASGSTTRWGIVAANWLPIGSKVQLPDLYGDEIFIVEDRMHERFSDRMDIWFPSKEAALKFGIKTVRVVVVK